MLPAYAENSLQQQARADFRAALALHGFDALYQVRGQGTASPVKVLIKMEPLREVQSPAPGFQPGSFGRVQKGFIEVEAARPGAVVTNGVDADGCVAALQIEDVVEVHGIVVGKPQSGTVRLRITGGVRITSGFKWRADVAL